MAEYEMPVEEQLRILVKKFSTFETLLENKFGAIDSRFDAIDMRLDGIDMRLAGVDMRLEGIDMRLDGVDKRLEGIDMRLEGVDKRLDGVDRRLDKIEIRLDKVHDTAKFGLEAVVALRESMNKKFDRAEKKHDEEIDLIKSVLVHVRKRADAPERSKPRPRRS